jgi:hypothetical protein
MIGLPLNVYIYIFLGVMSLAAFGYGKYQSVKYDSYVAKVEAAAQYQELTNKSKAKEAAQVNEKVKNDYENRIALIKRTYGGMRLSSSDQTGAVSKSTSSTDGTPADPKFIEKCAMTTQQLVSLQGWIGEQVGIYNAK